MYFEQNFLARCHGVGTFVDGWWSSGVDSTQPGSTRGRFVDERARAWRNPLRLADWRSASTSVMSYQEAREAARAPPVNPRSRGPLTPGCSSLLEDDQPGPARVACLRHQTPSRPESVPSPLPSPGGTVPVKTRPPIPRAMRAVRHQPVAPC